MKVNQFNSNNIDRLVKINSYLKENYDINVGKILPQAKLEKAYKNVEHRIANLRNKGSKFQQDPNYGMNIMVRDALGIMINEGMYYEGVKFMEMMEELYEYGCSLAEAGDEYDEMMKSCGKKYDTMPFRFPKDMVLVKLGEEMRKVYEIAPAIGAALGGAARAGAMGFGAGAGAGMTGGSVNLSSEKDYKDKRRLNAAAPAIAGAALGIAGANAVGAAGEKIGGAIDSAGTGIGNAARGLGDMALKMNDANWEGAVDEAEQDTMEPGSKEKPVSNDNHVAYLDKAYMDDEGNYEGNYDNKVDDKFAYILGKALGKSDYYNYSLGELFAELESIDARTADELNNMYKNYAKKAGVEPMDFKESFEGFLDELLGEMVTEEVESVEEAEVVMAARALSNDIQDHVERLGRMVNEDLPAIADQMASEFGVDRASNFKSNMEQVLNATLDANKAAKDGIDGLVGEITGSGSVAPAGDMGGMGDMPEPGLDDMPADNFDGADAEAGPLDEPLGRAEKE